MDLNFLIIGGVTAAFLFTIRILMNHFIEIRTLNLKPGTRDEITAGTEVRRLSAKAR